MCEFPKNSMQLFDIINDKNKLFQFISHHELIDKLIKCRKCIDKEAYLCTRMRGEKQQIIHRCNKCNGRWSASNNIFKLRSSSNLTYAKVLHIIWLWSQHYTIKQTVIETRVDEKSIIEWFKKIRKILLNKLENSMPL